MNLVPVEGENHLYRDANTNAIVNTNQSEHAMYISRRKIHESDRDKINRIEGEVTSIKNDLGEIKELLKNLTNRP